MTDLRTAAQQALEACTDAVSGWQSLAPLAVRRAAEATLDDLRAALAEPVLQTCNCRWDGEVQVQQCTLHEAHVDAIHEWAERAKTAEKKLAALAEPVQGPDPWGAGYEAGYAAGVAEHRAEPVHGPLILFLADELEIPLGTVIQSEVCRRAAKELRRLHAELERCKQVCAATSESWRTDAEKWKDQRDALLEALKTVEWHGQGSCWVVDADKIAAAIAKAEENT